MGRRAVEEVMTAGGKKTLNGEGKKREKELVR